MKGEKRRKTDHRTYHNKNKKITGCKKMKKILALVLSVIMLLSVMPVVYAAEASVKDTFIEEYAKFGAYIEYNAYAQEDINISGLEVSVNEILKAGKENDEEKLLVYTEMLKEKNSIIEKDITDGKLTVVIDAYYAVIIFCKLYFYNDFSFDINGRPLYIFERNTELFEDAEAAHQDAFDVRNNRGTQEEYDAVMKKCVDACSLALDHLYGNHDFIEYISNNDATEEADGTKTAICELCGATDTVVDEGSKLVKEEESLSFFARLIALIKAFFEKIFAIFA